MAFIVIQWNEKSTIYNLLEAVLEQELVQHMVEEQERGMVEAREQEQEYNWKQRKILNYL